MTGGSHSTGLFPFLPFSSAVFPPCCCVLSTKSFSLSGFLFPLHHDGAGLTDRNISFFSHTGHEDVASCEIMKVSQLLPLLLPDSWPGLTDCLEVIAIIQVSQVPAMPLAFSLLLGQCLRERQRDYGGPGTGAR